MRTATLLIATLCTLPLAASQAAAPEPAPTRLMGTVERVESNKLVIKTAEGSGTVTLPENLRVTNNRKASLTEINSGAFIGTTAVQREDGKLHATEVHIFPEAMRGSGEGHRPWFAADTTMTNGSVTTMTNGSARQQQTANGDVVLTVAYKGGKQEVLVGPDVPVTMLEPGDRSMLKPGTKIVALVREEKDGTATALMISVGAFF
jgi:hypothetical protein